MGGKGTVNWVNPNTFPNVRAARRYPLSLGATVRSRTPGVGRRGAIPVRTRDMSSCGVSFYGGREWVRGEAVSLLIEIGRDVVSPYTYTLKVEGRVVRKDTDQESGTAYHAVEFDGPGKILDWREHSRHE